MFHVVIEFVGLFLAGILAGEEFVVRYGIHPALSAMDDRAHLVSRIALVRKLRIIVPVIMIPTVIVAVIVVSTSGAGTGLVFRILGMAALVAFLLFSFLGTVPINIKVNDTWDAEKPPADWKQLVKRWVFIDTFRSSAAILGFACFLAAAALEALEALAK